MLASDWARCQSRGPAICFWISKATRSAGPARDLPLARVSASICLAWGELSRMKRVGPADHRVGPADHRVGPADPWVGPLTHRRVDLAHGWALPLRHGLRPVAH